MEEKKIELNEKLREAVLVNKKNVFLTGSGGVGKSEALKVLAKEGEAADIIIAKCGSTGTAAFNIGGTTFHKLFGIGIGDKTIDEYISAIYKYKDKLELIRIMDYCVCDEISMISAELLETADVICKKIRGNNLPLGGIKVVFSGDFLQLKPVNGEPCFKSKLWKELKFTIIKLTKPHRFVNIEHYNFLQRIRLGEPSKEDIEKIKLRCKAFKEIKKDELIKPTMIYPRKSDVKKENNSKLTELSGEYYRYHAISTITDRRGKTTVTQSHHDYFKDNVEDVLILKVGAQVMLTVNMSVEQGLVNGSRGVVTECGSNFVVVLFKNDIKERIEQHSYDKKIEGMKYVKKQLPLILAYALTAHKIQGASLDCCVMDLGQSIFEENMAYVMLSRVRSLEGIYVTNFMPNAIRADKEGLKIDAIINKLCG